MIWMIPNKKFKKLLTLSHIQYIPQIVNIDNHAIQFLFLHAVIKHFLVHNVMDINLIRQKYQYQVIDIA